MLASQLVVDFEDSASNQANCCTTPCQALSIPEPLFLKLLDRPGHVSPVRGFVYSMYHAAGPKHPVQSWSYQVYFGPAA